MTAQIRRAGPEDAAAITVLTRAAYAKWVELIGREPLPMTVDYARAVVEHRIDLLEQDGALLGLIEIVPRAQDILIENIAIAPDAQGRGLGRQLLIHAETVARAAGAGAIRLYTNSRFEANIAFYHRTGYEIERTEPFRGGFVVHMVKITAAPDQP
jgi:ribosomal protein S18 acetylase RimI-like enzyme